MPPTRQRSRRRATIRFLFECFEGFRPIELSPLRDRSGASTSPGPAESIFFAALERKTMATRDDY